MCVVTFLYLFNLFYVLSIYVQFDDGKVVFSGEWTAEDIMEFIQSEQLPLVTTFSDEVGVW